ncbi:MAG: putative glycoside hydrolase [Steroidobacteraceae bacterium]
MFPGAIAIIFEEASTVRRLNAIILVVGIMASISVRAFTPDPFPRLASVNVSEPMNFDDPTYQASLSRFNLMFLMVYPGWDSGRSMTMNQSVTAIKKINPAAKVFLYSIVESMVASYPTNSAIVSKINSMNWWLYPNGTSGTPVPSTFPGATTVNTTLFGPTDSNGNHWVDWYAKFAVQNYITPNPAVDGLFTDNVFVHPSVYGDWNLDGVTDSPTNPTVQQWYQQGYVHYFSTLKQLMPGRYMIGNVSEWGQAGANLTAYSGMLNGGIIEGLIGPSWATETWGGWSAMMASYRQVMAAIAAPQLLIFSAQGLPTDYQTLRYGLASCLLDEGYFEFTNINSNYSGVIWFDEYNVKLGLETSPPARSAWQKGVYRRDFQNGIALVNPKGNGSQTVQLETNYRRISGTQDPVTNNGQVTNTVTLNDRDGIILLRLQPLPVPVPNAPASISVH